MNVLKKVYQLLNRKEKVKVLLLTTATLAVALLELAGIGSIGPFMMVATDPSSIEQNKVLSFLYLWFNFQTPKYFLFALGIASFTLILGSNALISISLYYSFRFAGQLRHNLGLKLFKSYLYQPYTFFLNHNTSALSKNLLMEVDQIIEGIIFPLINSFSRGVASLLIIVFLLVLNPFVALISTIVLGFSYLVIFFALQKKITFMGGKLRELSEKRFKIVSETFSAIKDIKILGKETSFENQYSIYTNQYAINQALNRCIITLPKLIIESIAFGLLIVVVLFLLRGPTVPSSLIAQLSVFAFAGYRLLPSFQTIFSAFSSIRYSSQALDAFHKDLLNLAVNPSNIGVKTFKAGLNGELYPFSSLVAFCDLAYQYPGTRVAVLRGINMEIKRNTVVGFVGSTGCGKTTLVDILLGLLVPTSGNILVDGKPLSEESISSWQRNFGYVPQQIFLCDDTIESNIAFGLPSGSIDKRAVVAAARLANLHDYIVHELQEGYETVVGERGIRLSGGQRQRVGIARALYHNPDILVLDEATSALDTITENIVMDAINKLQRRKTIILIAHRLSTVQECDNIYLLEKGKIVASGSYSELIKRNNHFRSMAKIQ